MFARTPIIRLERRQPGTLRFEPPAVGRSQHGEAQQAFDLEVVARFNGRDELRAVLLPRYGRVLWRGARILSA